MDGKKYAAVRERFLEFKANNSDKLAQADRDMEQIHTAAAAVEEVVWLHEQARGLARKQPKDVQARIGMVGGRLADLTKLNARGIAGGKFVKANPAFYTDAFFLIDLIDKLTAPKPDEDDEAEPVKTAAPA